MPQSLLLYSHVATKASAPLPLFLLDAAQRLFPPIGYSKLEGSRPACSIKASYLKVWEDPTFIKHACNYGITKARYFVHFIVVRKSNPGITNLPQLRFVFNSQPDICNQLNS
jgi:hypothetical protein